ncbi:MAG: roadblock/LC7 domain-containing protein [Candidatus Sumerlaeia bacterium]|nr:roadblock/LC7 domain-containing protein [Candidatus Sumerlaeia bacterium]
MIVFSRGTALVLGLLVALVATPLAASLINFGLDGIAMLLPIVVILELVLYFGFTLFSSPRATLGNSMTVAILFFLVRLAACMAAFIPASGLVDEASFAGLWAGNPVSVALQVLLLMSLGGHALAHLAPGFLPADVLARLGGGSESRVSRDANPRPQASPHSSSAAGGFVQVFSYEELSGTLRKTQGLEGFVIYSNEGLVVWRDLPMRIEVDSVVAKVMSLTDQFNAVMDGSGLTRVRRVMVESKEHFLFTTPLNSNFGLMMLFNSGTSTEEILARIAFVSKTTREFLQWKYPALPLVTGLSQDRNPMLVD